MRLNGFHKIAKRNVYKDMLRVKRGREGVLNEDVFRELPWFQLVALMENLIQVQVRHDLAGAAKRKGQSKMLHSVC